MPIIDKRHSGTPIGASTQMACSGILYGTLTVGGGLLSQQGLTALDISFFFLLLSVLPAYPLLLLRRKSSFFAHLKQNVRFLSIYSLVGAFLVLSQFVSLGLGLSPAITALLLYTQPIWTIVFGRLRFKEQVTPARVAIIVLSILGVLLVVSSNTIAFSSIRVEYASDRIFAAELISLLGGVFLSLWIILGKSGKVSNFADPLELTVAVRSSVLIPVSIVCIFALAFNRDLFLASPLLVQSHFASLFGFSIIAGILPDFLFYSGIDRMESLRAGVILLLEPISAAGISWVLGMSNLGWSQLLGAALILFSNYLIIRETNKDATAINARLS